ncbi:MAG: CHASE2 and HATPase_c domain-containing protein [Acidobacteriota bacterium]|nr:CHASE2 and HATPase_c domain-containing protein [Acidobacteriota bacterium]
MKFAYAGVLALALLLGVAASWTAFGLQIDNYAYDFIFRLYRPAPWHTESIVLAIDEESLSTMGGIRGMRTALAEGLERIRPAHPKAVAIDVILSEAGDEASDSQLELAFERTPNLVLSCDLMPDGKRWEDPIPRFRKWAVSVGHVYADLDRYDAVSREIPLEKATEQDRRWALALEAFRVSRHAQILESPDELKIGTVRIPVAPGTADAMRIRYVPPSMDAIPRVSLKRLRENPRLVENFAGKVVFAGVTAQTFVRDRWMTPYSNGISMPGVEMNANAFETIANGLVLGDAPRRNVLLFCLLLVAAVGAAFASLPGWPANAVAGVILVIAHVFPYALFTRGVVFPWLPGVAAAWLAIVTAAAWRHFYVRRRLGKSESELARYQQAMHMVTHELRTPLTAIQGSSELMSRYALPDEKRKQIAEMIHSESKRLGQMISTFLDIERFSAGQMEMRRESFAAADLVESCIERARPVADRKRIEIRADNTTGEFLSGDRELLEYALYNLLTNAVKYSPPETTVRVEAGRRKDRVQIAVRDQGIGIDPKEAKKVFQKFYRTQRAEQSGEAGTGIGLAIVEQIVERHGGSIYVESAPGEGSCFTLELPCGMRQCSVS